MFDSVTSLQELTVKYRKKQDKVKKQPLSFREMASELQNVRTSYYTRRRHLIATS